MPAGQKVHVWALAGAYEPGWQAMAVTVTSEIGVTVDVERENGVQPAKREASTASVRLAKEFWMM